MSETVRRAVGIFLHGDSYRLAADALTIDPPKGMRFDDPMRFLYFHAVELFLKAPLIMEGWDEERLKKVGHKLPSLWKEVAALGAHLEPVYETSINLFGQFGQVLETRYLVTGVKTLPKPEGLRELCAAVRSEALRLLQTGGLPLRG